MGTHVAYRRQGALGVIELCRPEALNALSLEMIGDIASALDQAERDSRVTTVAIWAPEGRAFSAGGDIRAIHDWGRAGQPELFRFYRDEYRLNARIARCPKPYVALVHGILMGGGAGVSLHGSHVVVAPDASFAMPEVSIGFVPDVGGSHFLNRIPGRAGLYLALTGERIGSADLVWSGLVKAVVPREAFEAVLEALARRAPPDEAIAAARLPEAQGRLQSLAPALDRLFAGPSVESILAALDAEQGDLAEWAAKAAALIRSKCPMSVKVTFALLTAGREAGLEQCLVNEFRAVSRIVQRPDFYEGVRATLIEKGRTPRWMPASLAEIPDAEAAAFLAPIRIGDVELA